MLVVILYDSTWIAHQHDQGAAPSVVSCMPWYSSLQQLSNKGYVEVSYSPLESGHNLYG